MDMERKEEIIQATFMLASKNGIDNVSMSQIATQLGIKKPSLYNHFRSKDEIAKAMYDYLRTQAKEKLKITDLDYGKLVKDKSLEEVLKLALDGEDFATLAKEYSDDSSASKGGDLGYFTQDEMVSAFSKAAFSLKTGEIYNKVVETSSGYHIIKKTGEKDQDFDDVKDDLIKTLESTKQSTLMQDLYTKYDVQIKNQ